jgi:hypothetical protein
LKSLKTEKRPQLERVPTLSLERGVDKGLSRLRIRDWQIERRETEGSFTNKIRNTDHV